MSHFTNSAKFPAFPYDVDTVDLPHVSLWKLRSSETESQALFEACRTIGFFLLDLRDDDFGQELLEATGPMFEIAENLFELNLETKKKYAFKAGQPIFGYKGYGDGKIDAQGTPDRCEFWSVSKDDILSISDARPNPSPIEDGRTSFRTFIEKCHCLVELICSHLDSNLGLPPNFLASHQKLAEPSGNQVRLIKTAPQSKDDRRTSLVSHTDIGTITVLFNVLGGLQVLPPGSNAEVESDWKFVKPKKDHAVINIGDAMVQWTNGLLRSNMHRVTFAPGDQSEFVRYSVAYFARPESKSTMKPFEQSKAIQDLGVPDDMSKSSCGISAEEWERQKGISLRSGRNVPTSAGGRSI